MDKVTIVINGVGGCGKDTLVTFTEKHYKVVNVSAITPAKNMLALCGWNGVKSDRYRKFLSDLKKLMIEFNDYPTTYLIQEQEKFLESDSEIMYVHCRESVEIKKFLSQAKGKVVTLLIKPREELQGKVYGNDSDDCVYDYKYDYEYSNVLPLDLVENDFIKFLKDFIL